MCKARLTLKEDSFLLPPRPWPWCGGGVGSARCSLGTHPPCESSICQRFKRRHVRRFGACAEADYTVVESWCGTQCTRCVGWTRRQGWRSGRRRADGVVEPSIVKKQRPEPGCMTKEEVYRTKKQKGKGLGTKTRGYVGPWTQARMDGSAWSRPRERKSEKSRARASSTSGGSSFY